MHKVSHSLAHTLTVLHVKAILISILMARMVYMVIRMVDIHLRMVRMGLRKIRIGLRIAKTVHYSTAKRNTKTDCFPEFSARKSSNFKLELWLN